MSRSGLHIGLFCTISILLIFSGTIEAIYLNDFLVNSEAQKYNDDFPSVLVDSNGNFTVIWTKYCYNPEGIGTYTCGRAYLKRYSSDGDILLPATPLTPDSFLVLGPARVALLPSGKLVVTWTDYTPQFSNPPNYLYHHNFAQIYDSLGLPLVEAFRVDFMYGDTMHAFVTDIESDSGGKFLALWRLTVNYDGVFFQRFTEDGMPVDSHVKVDTCITVECSNDQDPFVTMHPDGHFVVVWYDNVVELNSYIAAGRLYDSAGMPVWSEAHLLTCDTNAPLSQGGCWAGGWTDVVMNESGNFMIFGNTAAGEPSSNSVHGRLFDPNGSPLTQYFKVNTSNPNTYDLYPRARLDGNGGYLVIWADSRHSYYDGPRDIFIQRYDSLSNPIGSNWRVNTPRGSPRYNWTSYGVASSGSRAFVVWKDLRDTIPGADTIRSNIYGQLTDISNVGFYLAGDVNFDGAISLGDVISLVSYIFKSSPRPDPELWIGDVNADCRITLADVIYLVNYVFRGGLPPQTGCAK